jgi:eukaryotic-like serine/threonine-protein kinase
MTDEGSTLAEMIEGRRVGLHEAVRVIQAAAEAIGAAHDSGVVHGDLKGSNVVVTPSGDVKITELGTSPVAEATPADDVCALASLLLEALAVSSGSQSSVGPAEPTAKVRIEANAGGVVDAMLRSLSREPDRLRSAQDFAQELEKAALRMRPEETAGLPPAPEAAAPLVFPDLVGRIIAGRYQIEEVIGRGSTSIVYRARHLELASSVAIKMLAPLGADVADEAMHDRFEFEAQVLASMRHPNVITIFDLGTTDDGLRYIAMELLQGETLASLLRREPRLSPVEAVSIVCQVAEALAALHERGLIHRDVKPANLFVTTDGADQRLVKLMDFGLVRALGGEPARVDGPRRRMETQAGVILGTGAYMSPELIQGQRIDARSDVYALGVVTYRLLTGTLPFDDLDMPRLLARHITDPVEPPSIRAPEAEIPSALERAVLRALAKAPEARPATARAFADDLRGGLGTHADSRSPASTLRATALSTSVEHPSGPSVLAGAPMRRRRAARWVTTALVVPAAALTLYAIAAGSRSSSVEPPLVVHASASPRPPVRPPAPKAVPARPPAPRAAPAPQAASARPATEQKKPTRRAAARRPPPEAATTATGAPASPSSRPPLPRLEEDLKGPNWSRTPKR